MTDGIIDRFRSLPIARSAVLNGHVLASVTRNLVTSALVVAVALLMGFRPTANPVRWAGRGRCSGVVRVRAVVPGDRTRPAREESRGGQRFHLRHPVPPVRQQCVRAGGDHATWLRWFAENQPVTPIIETVRGLLMQTPVGNSAWLAVGWCVAIAAVGYAAATTLYRRRTPGRPYRRKHQKREPRRIRTKRQITCARGVHYQPPSPSPGGPRAGGPERPPGTDAAEASHQERSRRKFDALLNASRELLVDVGSSFTCEEVAARATSPSAPSTVFANKYVIVCELNRQDLVGVQQELEAFGGEVPSLDWLRSSTRSSTTWPDCGRRIRPAARCGSRCSRRRPPARRV